MSADEIQNVGESRFTDYSSTLQQNNDRFLGGKTIRGAAQLAAISQNWTITATHPATYTAAVRSWRHGRILVTHCVGDGVTFHRTAGHVGDSFDIYVQIAVVKSGKVLTTQRGVKRTLGPNSVVMLLLDEEFISVTSDKMDILLFYIPRNYLESRWLNTGHMAGAALNNASVCESIRALTRWAFTLPQPDGDSQGGFIERALLELLTSAGAQFTEGFTLMDDSSVSTRQLVLNIIDSSYTDPGLSVASMAKQLGFSRRHIYRIFEGRDVSIAKMIRERRIEQAELMLRLPGRMPMASVATGCGFSGPDQMARAFKERHACTPLEYRLRNFRTAT